jgi:hypothetical protein
MNQYDALFFNFISLPGLYMFRAILSRVYNVPVVLLLVLKLLSADPDGPHYTLGLLMMG